MQSEVIVYAVPFLEERHMTKGDVAAAVAWFKETTGQDASLIVLNPKNEQFADKVPDGVKVEYLGGCLAWEIWLSAQTKEFAIGRAAPAATTKTMPGHARGTHSDVKQPSRGVPVLSHPAARETLPLPILSHPGRGRKPMKLPIEMVRRLASEGMGSRKIAEALQGDGIDVSYRTVGRMLKQHKVVLTEGGATVKDVG